MKTFITFVLFVISLNVQALMPGQCSALHMTKRYISFPETGSSYPKSYSFKCDYLCIDDLGISSTIVGKTQLTLGEANPNGLSGIQRRNMEAEARRLVCQGVQVKEVSWGYDFDYVKSFYSHKTLIKEIRVWAEKNVSKNNQFEITELTKAKEILLQSARAYLTAGRSGGEFLYFQKAGIRLSKIASELPYTTNELDKVVEKYKKLNGIIPSINTEIGLVMQQISLILYWKLPIF